MRTRAQVSLIYVWRERYMRASNRRARERREILESLWVGRNG